jgi:hypothetical protein
VPPGGWHYRFALPLHEWRRPARNGVAELFNHCSTSVPGTKRAANSDSFNAVLYSLARLSSPALNASSIFGGTLQKSKKLVKSLVIRRVSIVTAQVLLAQSDRVVALRGQNFRQKHFAGRYALLGMVGKLFQVLL